MIESAEVSTPLAGARDQRALPHIQTLQIGNDSFQERQGGLNRYYSELLKYLPAAGVQVRGLVVGNTALPDTAIVPFASPQAPVVRRLLQGRRAALNILRDHKPDLIATHFALYALPLLDRLGTLPTVIHFHGPWAAEAGVEGKSFLGSRLQAAIERAVYSKGQRIIVLSHAFAGELTRRYKVAPDLIRVLPGGIDAARFNNQLTRRAARERLGWPLDRPIVLTVRRQMKRMGLENLIDAIRQVKQAVPDVLVLLAGTGPLAGELQQRITDVGLQQHVHLLGRLDDADLPLAYRAADLSIVPSQALEGFGMITLESLASGTPVLVTPVGGLPEVLRPFAPGCILPGTTAEIIADTLSACLRGTRILPTSQACRNYAAENFSWQVIAARTREVYLEAMQ